MLFFLCLKTLFVIDLLFELFLDGLLYFCPFCPQKKKQKRMEKMRFRIYFLKNDLVGFLFKW
jgi:hypothetical protein